MQNIISNKKVFLCLFIIFSIFWASDIKAETYTNIRWVSGSSTDSLRCVLPSIKIDDTNCTVVKPGDPYVSICCGSVSKAPSETGILKTPPLEKIKTVFTPQAPIPGIDYGSLEGFVSSIYSWGIGLVGILALVQLIRGGFMYMISGAVDKKSEAKSIITDAFIGLALALGSYLIIYTINPAILIIKFPKAPPKTDISGGLPSTASSTPSVPIEEGATEGLIRKCMPHEELQSYMDYNKYKCIVDPEKAGTCPIGEGAFICTLSIPN